MTKTAQLWLDETKAIQNAVHNYYISPGLLIKVIDFAREQDLYLSQYVHSSELFFLSDGEGYSAQAILQHFEITADKLILPPAVDEPLASDPLEGMAGLNAEIEQTKSALEDAEAAVVWLSGKLAKLRKEREDLLEGALAWQPLDKGGERAVNE